MKKLLIILFALMLALSGCGWEVEIVDPSEQIAEPAKPETEKPSKENTVTEIIYVAQLPGRTYENANFWQQ